MSTKDSIKSMFQSKSKSAMDSAFDDANEVVARANNVGPKAKK